MSYTDWAEDQDWSDPLTYWGEEGDPPPPDADPPVGTMSATGGVTGPPGTEVTFTIHATDGDPPIASWELDFDDGTPATGSGNPDGLVRSHTYTQVGRYSPVLTLTT